jgi:hypothetical protein
MGYSVSVVASYFGVTTLMVNCIVNVEELPAIEKYSKLFFRKETEL